jgi:tripartite ATP-independent transporter DctM subunit
VGGLVYREIKPQELPDIFRRSLISTSIIMLIIAAASLISFLISYSGAPTQIAAWMTGLFDERWTFLLAINVVLLIVGMFVETSAAIIVLAPIFMPIALQFGVDPVHFGLIMVVNLALGMITPPLGVNLFAACTVAKIPLDRIIGSLLPFVGVVFLCLMIVTYVPEVSLFLRDLLYAR